MKLLKSTSEDLKLLFDQHISAKHIAESFRSFDDGAKDTDVKAFMVEMEFDVIGVRQKGKITGYTKLKDLNNGSLKDHVKKFGSSEIISHTTSLTAVIKSLKEKERLFVTSFNDVSGIITKGDLQKHPVRMWLFGIISLIEMQMLRIIREFCPAESWQIYLNKGRLKRAYNIYKNRQQKNQHIDLVDCIQFCDKSNIILMIDKVMIEYGDMTKADIEFLLKQAEEIRNVVAHSQDFLEGNWPEITNITEKLLIFLKKSESVSNSKILIN